MFPANSALAGSSQRLHRLTALAVIYSCLPLHILADASGVCNNAAGNLLASLAVDQPDRYSADPCALAPLKSVCDVTGASALCADVASCSAIATHIDTSCTPRTLASACCTTFFALPCPDCSTVPLGCLQFCLDNEPAASANNTASAPAPATPVAPDPSPSPAPANANTTGAPPRIGTAPAPSQASAAVRESSGGSEDDLTPAGMPRQIIVESLSRAESAVRQSPLTAAAAALSLLALVCHGGC